MFSSKNNCLINFNYAFVLVDLLLKEKLSADLMMLLTQLNKTNDFYLKEVKRNIHEHPKSQCTQPQYKK